MSRKNPFATLDLTALSSDGVSVSKAGYGMTGAAKTVVRSIEEMAENTKKLMDGETIVELDPASLDVSFVADRLSDQDMEYEELRTAIREHGQSTPILVRPNPDSAGRYMVVFGHRRVQVANDLGIKVKAVVKKLDDIASAVAQGQENSARSNLSFIERAFFAQNLLLNGITKDVAKSSLGVDDAMLSKMLGVIEAVPPDMLRTLGSAKKIGRDKWLSLRQLILNPAYLKVALDHISKSDFADLEVEKRFDCLHDYLKRYKVKSTAKTAKKDTKAEPWVPLDKLASVSARRNSKALTMEFSNPDGKAFGAWISNNLDGLYEAFRKSKDGSTGD